MSFPKTRIVLAAIFAVVWFGWAVWANIPLYYDIQALRNELAVTMPSAVVEPASTGFPLPYMRYEYTRTGQLVPIYLAPSAALPNLLFCLTGIAGALLLVFRTRQVTIGFVALLFVMVSPAVLLYVLLNGFHPDVVAYLYLTPLAMFLALQAIKRGENREVPQSFGGESNLLTASIVETR